MSYTNNWVRILRESYRSLYESVDEKWFEHQDTFDASKRGKPISYEVAGEDGTTETLEGPVRHMKGHRIITGPKGEKYPVAPDKFAELYDDGESGKATPKAIRKRVRLADHDGVVKASWGDLNYKSGQHYIVRHGDGDYGVVEKDIFDQTYQRH